MRTFADPSSCPDCGSRLPTGSTTCISCRLDLSGELGLELFTTLTRADSLLTQLRARSRSATHVAPAPAGLTRAAARPARRPASVPQVLLALGAVCLLVAALVFLAVTWSVMGVGGRTATLVGFTLTAAALTAWAARGGLRGAVEALGVVTLGLAVLDLYGAENAGWLGDLSSAAMTTLVGAALVAGGLAAVRAVGGTAAKGFTCGELAVVAGATLVSVGLASQTWGPVAARQLLALCLVLALTASVWTAGRTGSTSYRIAVWGLVPLAGLDWLALVLGGLDDLGTTPTMASAWGRLEVWPLLAAAGVALAIAALRHLPPVARVGSAALGLVPLGLAALAPAGDEPVTGVVLAVVALSAALVALMSLAPSPWGASGLAAAGLCALGLALESLSLVGAALEQYVDAASMAWTGTPAGRRAPANLLDGEAPWLLPVCVLALTGLVWSAARLLEDGRALRPQGVLGVAAAALGSSLVATLLLYPVPVWAVLLALVGAALLPGWWALSRDAVPGLVTAAAPLSAAVVLSCYDEQLGAVTLAVAFGLAIAAHLRTGRELVAAAAGGSGALLLTGLVWTVAAVVDAGPSWAGLAGLLLLATLVLGRHAVPVGLRTPGVRATLELSSGGAAVVLVSSALALTPAADQSTWLAVYLTVAGAAATVLSLIRRDRRRVAWLGGLLLASATWVRLSDLGVEAPEPYTLPTAVALFVVGLLRLRRDGSASTHQTLGAGLLLALVPSLLWVASEPGGVRSVVLGLACLGLVVGGAQLRWVAPLAHGAVVGLVVVLVEAGPHLGAAVPRWALIGAAGALLIAVGVTWEQRLRDARLVTTYVRALR